VKKRVCLWRLIPAHAPGGLAGSSNPRNVSQQLVRSTGSSKVPTKKFEVTFDKSNAEVMQWVSQNRGSREGTLERAMETDRALRNNRLKKILLYGRKIYARV
jgi:hypothetical protein